MTDKQRAHNEGYQRGYANERVNPYAKGSNMWNWHSNGWLEGARDRLAGKPSKVMPR